MDEYTLHLFAHDQRIGALAFDPVTEAFSLQYEASWVQSPKGFALSPHLPLEGLSTSGAIRRFIENLLPEGRALDVASIHSNIQKNNIFGLIRQLGAETAGALCFLPAGQTPQGQTPVRRELGHKELQDRIDARNQVAFSIWDGRVRMSVAGFQDKLLVLVQDGKLFLADGALASTHILKPEPLGQAMPHMVANEHFCMRLASRISLRRYQQDHAASVEILRMPSPVLAIRRFDRHMAHDQVERIHIIDGCQVLDMPVSAKYERNMGNGGDVAHIRDGVSFERLLQSRVHLELPAVGIQRMVLWATTTLLLGNSDAHGKNISFYCGRAGLRVAELYDLVSVFQYDAQKYEHTLAMAFGDASTLSEIRANALADFCVRSGIPRAYFVRELTTICKIALEELQHQALDPSYLGEEVAFVRQIADFVHSQAIKLLAIAPEISRFRRDEVL